MNDSTRDVATALANNVKAVCRHYLSNGRREGRYWQVGDTDNTPGRSLYVRLQGGANNPAAVGRWTDAATGEHGDLLDLIAAREGLHTFTAVLDEARRFLSLPRPNEATAPARQGSPEAARRLFDASRSIRGTVGAAYLRARGIDYRAADSALRFHAGCFYRPSRHDVVGCRTAWPAMIAAITDMRGTISGVHRTWLDPSGAGKAPVRSPRRAMGSVLGAAIRFGPASEVMAAGEGIETVLSVRTALPAMSMLAAGSAAHLGSLEFPSCLRRLYVLEDADEAGRRAMARLRALGRSSGIVVIRLRPRRKDFNEDLRRDGVEPLRGILRSQLRRKDVERFGLGRPVADDSP